MKRYSTILLALLIPQFSTAQHFSPRQQQLPTEEQWWSAVCRGERLDQAMTWPDPQANAYIEPLHSPWDGNLTTELFEWGYTEFETEQICNFDAFWGLAGVFQSLGIDSKSGMEGEWNSCFGVSHGDAQLRKLDGSVWPLREQIYSVDGNFYRVFPIHLVALLAIL